MLVLDHEPVAERRQRVLSVQPQRVVAGHSHASTAFQSGLSGSRWPKWSSSGSTISDAPLAAANRCADLHRHDVVQPAVREQRGHAEREPLDRGRDRRRVVAEEAVDDAVGQPQLARSGQVQHARLGDDAGERDLRRLAGRRPRRQVPAGAVADRHDATAVHRQVGQQIDRGGHVVERRGHAAAVAEPAVLDVPRRPAARGEILRQRLHQVQSVLVLPEPAVDEHRDRPLAVQHAVLRGVVAVPMKLRLQGSGVPPRAW